MSNTERFGFMTVTGLERGSVCGMATVHHEFDGPTDSEIYLRLYDEAKDTLRRDYGPTDRAIMHCFGVFPGVTGPGTAESVVMGVQRWDNAGGPATAGNVLLPVEHEQPTAELFEAASNAAAIDVHFQGLGRLAVVSFNLLAPPSR